jgi:hypothetical protein
VDFPPTPVPRRERLDSGSSTTSDKTENSEALRELDLEVQPTIKPPSSGLLLKNKLPTVKKEITTSNLKQGIRKTTTTGRQSRYCTESVRFTNQSLQEIFLLTTEL